MSQDPIEIVPQKWRHVFRQALLPQPEARAADAEILLAQLMDGPPPNFLFAGFETYDEINDRYVILPDAVGEGGIARVYHVDDMLHRRQYAAKFVKPELADRVDAESEFLLLQNLPPHPCIVRPELLQQAQSLRRNGIVHELRAVFMLSEWVDGTRLDHLLQTERIPRARAVEIALEVAEALVHLQTYEVFHRDVKPQNVIIDREGRPRLVDFNVGRTTQDAGETRVGTPGYRPPDLEISGWGTDSDPFALCVTLAEMLAGTLLADDVRGWLETDPRLPETLRDLLRRGTASAQNRRFVDATSLADALRETLIVLRQPPRFNAEADFPTAPTEELERPNWNPYQNRLLTLFSQSSATNKGTRGLDEFDRWAYVPTMVDRELYNDIGGGRFKLVVITGNAGDGKTAFIQMLEQRLLDDGAEIEHAASENGAIIRYEGRRMITNLDGSQDEGDRSNDDVLDAFFAPFAGVLPAPPDGDTHVIAINEGRLIDFVTAHRDHFAALERAVMGFVSETEGALPDWLLIVNLNLRALTTGPSSDEHDEDSLTHEVLKRFADERVWQPCEDCVAFAQCYARANAATLRDPVLGPRTAERIRQTLDLVRLRRQMHITMRDLRSALAYLVAGTRSCDEIVELASASDEPANAQQLLAGHTYNALFAASTKFAAPLADPAARRDRLLRTAAAVDVAKTANPGDDARLWLSGSAALRPDPEGLNRGDRVLIELLRTELPSDPHQLTTPAGRLEIAFVQASLRRKLYLEREEPEWVSMLPYARLGDFQRQLASVEESDLHAIVAAISNSEGLFGAGLHTGRFVDQLAVRLVTDVGGPERSFVPHPSERFDLQPLDRREAALYVEYQPDSLRLVHRDHRDIALEIDLDLYETLMRIRAGHTPSREELRGSWLNLRVFKERLASLPAPSLLLSPDGVEFHTVERDDAGGVSVQAVV